MEDCFQEKNAEIWLGIYEFINRKIFQTYDGNNDGMC